MNRTLFVLAAVLALASSQMLAQQPRVEMGSLAAGDGQLESGEYRDVYTFQGRTGQRVSIVVNSTEFDTYLALRSPSGNDTQNDDDEGNTQQSKIEMTLDEDGEWAVLVTSFKPGETGRYTLTMNLGGGGVAAGPLAGMRRGPLGGGAKPPAVAMPGPSSPGARVEQGELAAGDGQLESGEYRDLYPFEGRSGQRVSLLLNSTEFDTYLALISPSGKATQNDDDEGNTQQSKIEMTLDEDGQWGVMATSYQAGETGRYTLTMNLGGAGAAATPAAAPAGPLAGMRRGSLGGAPKPPVAGAGPGGGSRVEQGELAPGDEQLSSGEYADLYTFQGVPGQRARIDLRSSDFDTYLIVRPSSGEQSENDDATEGSTNHSAVELSMVAGEYTILVTSYTKGETGRYQLTISIGG